MAPTKELMMRSIHCAFVALAAGLVSLAAYGQTGWTELNGNTTTPDKVGIGYSQTNPPTVPLDILANVTTPLRISSSVNPGLVVGNGSTSLLSLGIPTTAGNFILNSAVNDVAFRADGGGRILFSTASNGSTNDLTLSGGKVGIGAVAPQFPLDIKADVTTPLRITGAANPGFVVAVNGTTKLTVGIPTLPGNFINNSLANDVTIRADGGGKILFSTATDGTTNDLTLAGGAGGYVGIGIANPQYKLHVAGAIKADQVIGAVYQDVAEWVPASEEMRAGTVVVVDPDADNGVMPSSQPYDTRVAGVVSAQPGVILGVEGASKAKVATTGRVKIRVDATRAPIRAGDLLVTSAKSGTAMRSEPIDLGGRKIHQPGTIIGKALQPLKSGEGEILVLLSLQ
jgi:hypothetical protein